MYRVPRRVCARCRLFKSTTLRQVHKTGLRPCKGGSQGGLTVRWGDMRGSGNVEDRESAGPAGGIGGGIKLGGVGLIVVLAVSWFLGLNPLDVLMSLQDEDTSSAPTQSAPPPSTSAPGARDETK